MVSYFLKKPMQKAMWIFDILSVFLEEAAGCLFRFLKNSMSATDPLFSFFENRTISGWRYLVRRLTFSSPFHFKWTQKLSSSLLRLANKPAYLYVAAVILLFTGQLILFSQTQNYSHRNIAALAGLPAAVYFIYVLLSSPLAPLKAILSAMLLIPEVLKSNYVVYILIFSFNALQGAPSYLSRNVIIDMGKTFIPFVLFLSVAGYSGILSAYWRLIPAIARIEQQKEVFNVQETQSRWRRLAVFLLFALLISVLFVGLRIAANFALQNLVFRGLPFSRQLILLTQYVFLASTAFIMPALTVSGRNALLRGLVWSNRHLLPIAATLFLLSFPGSFGGAFLQALTATATIHSLVWWSFVLLNELWQALVLLLLHASVCLMFFSKMVAERRG